jgi:dihydropteroate synthase
LAGSLACAALAWQAGAAAVRVHDVAPTRDLLAVLVAAAQGQGRDAKGTGATTPSP